MIDLYMLMKGEDLLQNDVAEIIGCTQSHVSRLKDNKVSMTPIQRLQLETALGKDVVAKYETDTPTIINVNKGGNINSNGDNNTNTTGSGVAADSIISKLLSDLSLERKRNNELQDKLNDVYNQMIELLKNK